MPEATLRPSGRPSDPSLPDMAQMNRTDACRLIDFPKVKDHRGNLTFIEGSHHIPYDIKRVFYLYDVPGGESRSGHAHRALRIIIIAVNGSFDVVLDDGRQRRIQPLSRANQGLFVCPGIWTELQNFTSGSVGLVLASELYDEGDYYRDYGGFLQAIEAGVWAP